MQNITKYHTLTPIFFAFFDVLGQNKGLSIKLYGFFYLHKLQVWVGGWVVKGPKYFACIMNTFDISQIQHMSHF